VAERIVAFQENCDEEHNVSRARAMKSQIGLGVKFSTDVQLCRTDFR